jgi:hypothetical protein
VNFREAFSMKANLDVRGYDTRLVAFDDGKFGVTIKTKAGPSVHVSEIDFLDVALDIVEQLPAEPRRRRGLQQGR